MSVVHPSLQFTHPLPYGAIVHDGGVQFVIFSRSATGMRVLLYDRVEDRDPSQVVDFHPEGDRWGDIWSVFVPLVKPGQLYHFQADGPYEPAIGQRFDSRARLIDPYARALAGDFLLADDGIVRPPKCVVVDDTFDWQGDRHLRRSLTDSVIYEMHVRGFTASPTSKVDNPGTFLGVIEQIPYLKSLGVTAVELMPVHEFPTNHWTGVSEKRSNYWGYDPMAFFSPHRGYAASHEPGAQVVEFKQMVRALHQADIEVILDVVFNHTAEGNELGPTFSFKGLENRIYYMLSDGGSRYRNYSGCGNTINGNHPICREMIFLCLRHWVLNYHVDGFRFDLASILSRDRSGELVPNPPLVEAIGEDPLLSDTKIIAEAWDAAGAYQVGSFAALRWAEWNGRFRDDVRRFWRGDAGQRGHLATRLAGSSDLYEKSGRQPYHSINFVTSHDGFPLNDLVSYSEKHNEANGEDNRDGDNNNFSANYGIEGSTRQARILKMRGRQLRNFLATLLLSQGVPMLLAGDEARRTQRGNNNAYCQDNATSWFDWRLVKRNKDLVRFCRALIEFRKRQPTLRHSTFLSGKTPPGGGLPDVSWFDHDGRPIDWQADDSTMTCLLGAWSESPETKAAARHVLILLNAGDRQRSFQLPEPARAIGWRLFVNTEAESPDDIYPEADGPAPPEDGKLTLAARSLVCYVSADDAAASAKAAGQQLRLADDEVQLWHVDPDTVPDALLTRYLGLLSADESDRYRRFRVEDARRQFLVTRALVRTTLSRYLGGEPRAWRFKTNEYGRPEVILPAGSRPLKFNVSHSHGRVVCAFAWERELGVDVEFLDRRGGGMHLARRFFSAQEADELEALPEDRQRSGFFDYWTLKEAYIKAHGKGLAIPLDQFTFLLRPGEPIRVECDPRLADDPASWQFLQFDLSAQHRLALAVRRSGGHDVHLTLHTATPLAAG